MSSVGHVIQKRKIKALVHFTRIENLDSIIKNGLHPRSNIDGILIDGICNDSVRADEKLDANCLSISFPNSKMFYRIRKEAEGSSWVVITFNPQVLIDKNCVFYPSNAACNNVRHSSISQFQGHHAFENMFANEAQGTSIVKRNEQGSLLDKDPTDVQAEVMVFDIIEPKYITGVIFEKDSHQLSFTNKHSTISTSSTQGYWGVFDDRKVSRSKNFSGE